MTHGDARHVQRRMRSGSQQHRTLQMLALGDACSSALRATCQTDCTLPDLAGYRNHVLFKLRDRELIESVSRDQWRLTPRGALALQSIESPPGSAGVQTQRRAGSVFEPPAFALPPGVDHHMLTSSPVRSMTEADKRPVPVRRDGMEFAAYPSRRGNRLYYRDGRVTDIAGNPVEVGA